MPKLQTSGADRERGGERGHQQAGAHAGDEQHPGQHRHEHRGAAEIGLERDQQHRRRRDRDRGRDLAQRQRPLGHAAQVARQVERGDQLGELRGLQADRADAEPALGTARLVAERQHRRQRHQRDDVERQRERQQRVVVEAEGREHRHDADRDPHDLPRQIVDARLGRRAVDGGEPDRRQRERRREQAPANRGQVLEARPLVRKRQRRGDLTRRTSHRAAWRSARRPASPGRHARRRR